MKNRILNKDVMENRTASRTALAHELQADNHEPDHNGDRKQRGPDSRYEEAGPSCFPEIVGTTTLYHKDQ